jgi:Leucine-rich repeat (LRR) protein
MKIKDAKILKNGRTTRYIKQKDGSWKLSVLQKVGVYEVGSIVFDKKSGNKIKITNVNKNTVSGHIVTNNNNNSGGEYPIKKYPKNQIKKNINEITLYVSDITGIGQLANLENLFFNYNDLTGGIPTEIGQLVNLENLSLNYNNLIGKIPTQIGQLVNLENLELNYNKLIGKIPTEIGKLVNLILLSLDGNQLIGEIPIEIGQLANLENLFFNYNDLTGGIPTEIGQLVNLENLSLNYNNLIWRNTYRNWTTC